MRKSYTHYVVFTVLILAAFAFPRTETSADDAGAHQLLALVNQERAKAGLSPLAWDDRLANAALEHAKLMAEKHMLSHQFSGEPALRLRLAKTSLRLDRSGENVAYDTTVEQAHVGLMNSPPHRANILSRDYNAVGMAVVRTGEYIYVAEDFAHRLPETSVLEIEQEIAANFNRLRKSAGEPPARQTQVATLRQAACAMAKNDEVNANRIEVPSARHILTFTMSDPSQLPANFRALAANSEIGSFAVGSCFQRSPTYPSGVFWNVIAFFPKADVKSGSR